MSHIWHDAECVGYQCGCTRVPADGKWRPDPDDDGAVIWYSELSKNRKREIDRQIRQQGRQRIEEEYGVDDFEDGQTIRFYKIFEEDGQLYRFAAIKCRGYWYVTGSEGGYSWIELIEFFELENILNTKESIFIPTGWDELYEEDSE